MRRNDYDVFLVVVMMMMCRVQSENTHERASSELEEQSARAQIREEMGEEIVRRWGKMSEERRRF